MLPLSLAVEIIRHHTRPLSHLDSAQLSPALSIRSVKILPEDSPPHPYAK